MQSINLKAIVFLGALLLASITSLSQHPVFKNYRIEDGLPSLEVYQVLQDSKGYIWFATDRGVSRFDGHKFISYTTEDGLPDNTIFDLYEDPNGDIWFTSLIGKVAYFSNDSIYIPELINQAIEQNFGPERARHILRTKDGTTIVSSRNRQRFLEIKNSGEVKWALKHKSDTMYLQIFDPGKTDQKLFVAADETESPPIATIIKQKKHRDIVLPYIDQLYGKLLVRQNMSAIKLNDGGFLMGNSYYLYRFDKGDSMKYSVKLLHNYNSFLQDEAGNIWIGTIDKGFAFFSNEDSLLQSPEYFLDGRSVTCIIQDNEGSYWISTQHNGVYYLPALACKLYTRDANKYLNQVYRLASGEKNLWHAYKQGGGLYKVVNHKYEQVDIAADLSDQLIYSLFVDSRSTLWGTSNSRRVFKKHQNTIEYQNHRNVRCIGEDNKNRILLGTTYGFKIVDNEQVVFKSDQLNFSERVESISCDQRGIIWLGTFSGLYSYNGKNIRYYGDQYPLLKQRVVDVQPAGNNTLWIATRGSGILMKHQDSIHKVSIAEGLLSNLCNKIYIEDEDLPIVWIATNKGVNRLQVLSFNPFKYVVQDASSNVGIQRKEAYDITCSGDSVWVATSSGLAVFPMTSIYRDLTPPPIHIQSIYINNNPAAVKTAYHLKYNQNYLKIDFAGLCYLNPQNIRYQYRMQGVDTGWIETDSRSVQYTTLPHGEYIFEVKAQNHQGVWSRLPARVAFNIRPAFWQTIWFKVLIIIMVMAGTWYIFFLRGQTLKKQALFYKRSLDAEQKALSAQLNPHFLFNAMNSIQDLIGKNERLPAISRLAKFSRLMRKVLNHSDQSFVLLSEELEALGLYLELEKMRLKNKLTYSVNCADDLGPELIKIPPMFIQPYVENAIWHGIMHKDQGSGQVDISFKYLHEDQQQLICTITDNGVGRKQAQLFKEIGVNLEERPSGMKINKDRLDLLREKFGDHFEIKVTDVLDQAQNICGTRVTIILPVKHD